MLKATPRRIDCIAQEWGRTSVFVPTNGRLNARVPSEGSFLPIQSCIKIKCVGGGGGVLVIVRLKTNTLNCAEESTYRVDEACSS